MFSEGTYSPIIRSCQFRLPGYDNFNPASYKVFEPSTKGHFTPPARASSNGELSDMFSVVMGENLVVVGGTDRSVAILDDVWVLPYRMPYSNMMWRAVQVVPDPTYGSPKPSIGAFLGVKGNSIFLFGGYSSLSFPREASNDMWELQLSADMSSATWAPIQMLQAPSGRYGMAGAVVESAMWLFGGRGSDTGGDRPTEILGGAGQLPLIAGQQNTWSWSEQYVGIALPLRLFGHVALYNTRDAEVMIYGGRSLSGLQNRAYAMGLRSAPFYRWKELNATGTAPPPMEGMSLDLYEVDGVGVKVLLFGGRDANGVYSNDLYELDYTSLVWTKVQVPGQLPAPRASHVAEILTVGTARGLLVYAGRNEQYLQDMWLYELASAQWLQLPSFAPEGRYDHTANEVLGGKMVVFGGVSSRASMPAVLPSDQPDANTCGCSSAASMGRIMFNDLWQYTVVNKRWQWQQITPAGDAPTRRAAHAAAVFSNKLIVFNGLAEDGTVLGDSWQYDAVMNRWSPLQMNQLTPGATAGVIGPTTNAPPPPLYRHFMGVRGRSLIVYGGMSATGAVGGLWSWSFATAEWSILDATSATGPGARYGHNAAIHSNDALVVMGGFRATGGSVSRLSDGDADGLSDIWQFSFSSSRWSMLSPMPISDNFGGSGGFSSSALIGSHMILFGSRRRAAKDTAEYSNAYAQYSIDSGNYEWQPAVTGPQPVFPSARAGASLTVMTTQAVFLFGGVGETGAMNDLWSMNLNPVCPINAPTAAKCFPCVPGTFFNAGKCNSCAQGSYSSNPGSRQCTSCPAGFYGVAMGASSLAHCVPCVAGTYSSGTGDIVCRSCDLASGAFCPLAAPKLDNLRPFETDMTSQIKADTMRRRATSGSPKTTFISVPDLLVYSRTDHQGPVMALLALMVILAIITGLVMYLMYRMKGVVAPFDWFRLRYKTTAYFSLYPKTLTKGFTVSLIGIFWFLCMLGAVALNMMNNNTREDIMLVPYALKPATGGSSMYFESRFYGTRGACQTQEVNSSTCSAAVKVSATGFSRPGVWDCARMQNEYCRVTWTCSNCSLASPVDSSTPMYNAKSISTISVMLTGDSQYASSVTAKLLMGSALPSSDSVMSTMMTSPVNTLYSGGPARVVVETLPTLFADYRNATNAQGNLFLRAWRTEAPSVDASTLHEKEGIGMTVELHRDANIVQWTRSEAAHLIIWIANIGGAWAFVSVLLLLIFYFFRTIDDQAQYKKQKSDFWDTEEALQRTRHQMFKEGRLSQKEFEKMNDLILAHNPELFSALESYALENPEKRGEEGRFDAYWRVARAVIRDKLFDEDQHFGEINEAVAVSGVEQNDEVEAKLNALQIQNEQGQYETKYPPPGDYDFGYGAMPAASGKSVPTALPPSFVQSNGGPSNYGAASNGGPSNYGGALSIHGTEHSHDGNGKGNFEMSEKQLPTFN
jgi:hypothetical protein